MDKVFIIAEAGVNHNGEIELARRLVDAAAEAGADAVKFQSFHAEKIVCKNAEKAAYQKEMTDAQETQLEMLKKLELTEQMHRELMDYCGERGIIFLSTPFDIDSIQMLAELGLQIFKIPSGEITNLPYLRKIGGYHRKIILSTGMSSMEEVEAAVKILQENGADDITLLHCNSQYPTPMPDVNLTAMVSMKKKLGFPVGYSDHTQGIEIPVAAVALGAVVIEKHFTLDRTMEGPDHKASLEPNELKEMVKAIRNIEMALGDGVKRLSKSEKENVGAARKSIVAAVPIKKGDIFTKENLTMKRPGTGISPMRWDELSGHRAKREYCQDDFISVSELERDDGR